MKSAKSEAREMQRTGKTLEEVRARREAEKKPLTEKLKAKSNAQKRKTNKLPKKSGVKKT